MKKLGFLIFLSFSLTVQSQPVTYTTQNAHSHNDYEQQQPFWLAYDHSFGSVEADVFLVNQELPVAHNAKDIQIQKTFKILYLDPLRQCIQKNRGTIYADKKKKLILLIDCKTEGVATLKKIVRQLSNYPDLTSNKTIRFVITGNQPNKDSLFTYPSFIWFDGNLTYEYTKRNLDRVALFSANFKEYSQWKSDGSLMNVASRGKLVTAITKAHQYKKPIRFWGAPDNIEAWTLFQQLGMDYINTDKISELAQFLQN